MLNIFRVFTIALLILNAGCQAEDAPDCIAEPLAENCQDENTQEDTSDPADTETNSPEDQSDVVDPEPEPEPEPEENADPLSTEAPLYHSIESLLAHLNALDQIAIANNNHRAAGTSGYEASVDYVKSQLESWGYEVTLQGFTIDVYDIGQDPARAHKS